MTLSIITPNDYTNYFDRDPLRHEFIGPTGLAAQSTQFSNNWIAWIDGTDIHYSGEGLGTDCTLAGISNAASMENMTFAIDHLAKIWVGAEVSDDIFIFRYYNGSYTTYDFAGKYPHIFFNGTINGFNQDVSCFYLKSDNKIYCRQSADDFSGEFIAHACLQNTHTLKQARKMPSPYIYEMGIWGQYENGNGFLIKSNAFESWPTGYFNDFAAEVSGAGFTGVEFGTEPDWTTVKTMVTVTGGDFYSQYPSGTIVFLSGAGYLASGVTF